MSCRTLLLLVLLTPMIACSEESTTGVAQAAPQGAPIEGAPIDGPAPEKSESGGGADAAGEQPSVTDEPKAEEQTTPAPDAGTPADERPMNDFKTAKNPAQHRINLPGALEKGKKPLVANDKGVIEVSFGHLASFPYLVPDPFLGEEELEVENVIPDRIQALDGKKVQVEGYMIPLDFNDDDQVTLFILSAFVDNCCFGKQANVNEWVEVELDNDQGVEFYPDGIVQVTGKLEVGELKDAYGYISGIYRMKAESVVEVW